MKKTIQSAYNTLIIAEGSEQPYFYYSSDWTNNGYKRPIPNGCFEFLKDSTYSLGLNKDSLISSKDIELFFEENPKRQKVIVYVGSQKYLDELNSSKFNPSPRAIFFYLNYLFFYKKNKKAGCIFLNEMNSLYPSLKLEFDDYYIYNEELNKYKTLFSENKDVYLDSLPFLFQTKAFVKEYSFDPNSIKVKDFNRFLVALKMHDFQLVEEFILCENFIIKFSSHKLFQVFCDFIKNSNDKQYYFNLLKDRIPFLVKDKYDLFNSFSFSYYFYNNGKDHVLKDLHSLLIPLSDESLRAFFKIYSDNFDNESFKFNEKVSILTFYKEYVHNFTLSLFGIELNPIQSSDLEMIIVSDGDLCLDLYSPVDYVKELKLDFQVPETETHQDDDEEDFYYEEEDLENISFYNFYFEKISANENLIKDIELYNCYINNETGLLDLSSFPNLNSLYENNCLNLKEVKFNSNVSQVIIHVDNFKYDTDLYSFDSITKILSKK